MSQRRFYRMSLAEIQESACSILQFIDSVCTRNNILYYLSFGTCLGAIRHKDIIPWDDDIDIYMTRREFNRFSSVMKKEHDARYKLIYLDRSLGYYQPLPKVIDNNTIVYQTQQNTKPIGVWVDVFILDNVPDDADQRSLFLKRIDYLNKCWMFAIRKKKVTAKSFKGKIHQLLSFGWTYIIPFKYLARYVDKYAQKYNGIHTTYCCNLTHTINPFGETLDKSILSDGARVQFHGHLYRVPKEYDTYLRNRYGDYMKLPPEENRYGHSSNLTYFLE